MDMMISLVVVWSFCVRSIVLISRVFNIVLKIDMLFKKNIVMVILVIDF